MRIRGDMDGAPPPEEPEPLALGEPGWMPEPDPEPVLIEPVVGPPSPLDELLLAHAAVTAGEIPTAHTRVPTPRHEERRLNVTSSIASLLGRSRRSRHGIDATLALHGFGGAPRIRAAGVRLLLAWPPVI